MGIQRFGLRVRDYATRITLGSTDSPANSAIAIIDGPGLAHYIYYGLCDRASAPVTYRACVGATIAWLDQLQRYGFKIEAIFFDGALPSSKKEVRIDRLQSYINRTQTFKQSSASSLSSMSGQVRKSLPPPPFLVFAVVEELRRSVYAESTYVVPGEADPYCIAAAQALPKDTECVFIYSDDADLMVYKASSNCRIIPFRDLSESKTDSGAVLTGDAYCTSEIVKRCQTAIEGLIKPAYFMSLDHHCSLERAFRMTTSSNPEDRDDFREFAEAFETADELRTLASIRADLQLKDALASRDSRVSELIHQAQTGEAGGLRMFLPFISDDPTRSSAWNVGADIRVLAYSTLLHAHHSEASVQEYKRSGGRVASDLIESLSGMRMTSMAKSLEQDITRIKKIAVSGAQLKRCDCWRYLAMETTLSHISGGDLALPDVDDITQVVMNREARKWHLLHLAAQYQAAYYSLRLLNQMLADVVERSAPSAVGALLAALHTQLVDLPSISSFFEDGAGSDRRHEQEQWREVLHNLVLGFSEQRAQGEQKSSRPRKKVKKQKNSAANDGRLVQNPFAMLAD